jgi:SAM-dependent methyltransferase
MREASSFGTAAVAYARHRPDYAPAAVRWAMELAPGPRVLDLGAGTGKLTGTLVALGADVIAVEPDPAMLTELRRPLPAIRALPGSADRGAARAAVLNAIEPATGRGPHDDPTAQMRRRPQRPPHRRRRCPSLAVGSSAGGPASAADSVADEPGASVAGAGGAACGDS